LHRRSGVWRVLLAGRTPLPAELRFESGESVLKIDEFIKNILVGETPQKPGFDNLGGDPAARWLHRRSGV
jgi:hypothetical protein